MGTICEEVGKLLKNKLLAEEAVALPGVGTLYVKRVPARRVSAKVVEPPYRFVEFSSNEEGLSLVDEIARLARCSGQQAADAYERWLSKSRNEAEGTLEILGVGTLCGKSFRPATAFERQLNPQGRTPVRIRRPMPWWQWSLATLGIVAVAAAVVGWLSPSHFWTGLFRKSEPVEVVLQQTAAPAQEAAPEASPASENLAAAEPSPAPESSAGPAPEPAASAAPASAAGPAPASASSAAPAAQRPAVHEIVRTRSGESYVVLGIFSVEANARRAVEQAEAKYESVKRSGCRIFRYGDQYLVSLGEAGSRSAAQELAARFRESGVPDVWVYSKR